MSFLPKLSDIILSQGDVRYQITYKDLYVDPSVMTVDDSHIHSCYEMYVNCSGNVSFLHGENLYKIKPGDVIFSEPGEVHHCIYNAKCVHGHYCLWFELGEDSEASNFLKRNKVGGIVRLDDSNKNKLLSLLSELRKNSDSFESAVLFYEILKLMKENTFYNEKVSIPEKMQNILEYVNEKFTEIVSVQTIADTFHVSVPTVNRWFREYLRLSPLELIRAKKLAYAEKLIRSEVSVTDACFRAGFTDCSRFIKLFKNNYGKTPLQYKKALGYMANES